MAEQSAPEVPLSAEPGPLYRTLGLCEIEVPRPGSLVIFGASGDLTSRKLIPSLFRLSASGMLSEQFFILGISRVAMNDAQFRAAMRDAVKEAMPQRFTEEAWDAFARRLYYAQLDFGDRTAYRSVLGSRLDELEKAHRTGGRRIYYLAIPPTVFDTVITNVGSAGLADPAEDARIVIEKPFGHDLDSARALNRLLLTFFPENRIFRIDHYLAKETVQNILMFRFANSIFEPLWNRRYIDHVQITASETLGVEHRAGYYEKAGVIRDMFQNHVLQILAITAMEPPSLFEAERVHDEKVKVFRSIRPFPLDRLDECVAVGQYTGGSVSGRTVAGYREEPGVASDSDTPTFAAMKIWIDNWRWQGVPFYLRSGKRLSSRKTEISIHYRQVPHSLFPETVGGPIEPNTLVLRVQPDEGMSLSFQAKQPGSKVCLQPVMMDYAYPRDVHLDAYEWVLLDCMVGDQLLFTRQDGVEQTWAHLMPVIEKLEAGAARTGVPTYTAGSQGPAGAAQLLERDGRMWRPL